MTRLMLGFVCLTCAASAQQGPVMSAVRAQYEGVKRNFVEAAKVMPEENYGYKLTPEQRAFGGWVEHTAGMNLRMCSTAKGETAPAVAPGQSKDALVKAIEASFAYCDGVIGSMTDEAALRVIGENPKRTALDVLISQIAQLNSHYGNMVGYLRTKGITPPSTARNQKK